MNAYELQKRELRILDLIDDNNGVLTPEMEEELDSLEVNKKRLIVIKANMLLEAKATEKALRDRKVVIEKRIKSVTTTVKTLTGKIVKDIKATGDRSVEFENFKISIHKNPPKVTVTDFGGLADRFKKATITVTIKDLKAIEAFLDINTDPKIESDKTKIKEYFKMNQGLILKFFKDQEEAEPNERKETPSDYVGYNLTQGEGIRTK